MDVAPEKLEKMVDYIEQAQPVLEKAAATEEKLAELAPKVVDALIEKGAVEADTRDRAVVNIQDPVKALECLHKMATASTEKSASATPPPSMGAGDNGVEESDKRTSEADRVFLRRFGFQ